LLSARQFSGADTLATEGIIYTMALQPDGKILVGGWFDALNYVERKNIARLNPNGSLDTSFNPGTNGTVWTLALQTDGFIILGGGFTTLAGVECYRIGRLYSDGNQDGSFIPGANDTVTSLAVQGDGKILVGGRFITLGGLSRLYIGRLSNDDAYQKLSVDAAGTSITWWRTRSSPEVSYVIFEYSTDGLHYDVLGQGIRSPNFWQLTGLSLPKAQNLWIRARGYYNTGVYNGSSSIVESVRYVYLNQSPEITSTDHTTFTTGVAGSFTVTATGFPVPTIGLSGALPEGVTFTDNGDGTATLAGTAAAGASGVYPLTITASNGVLPDASQDFTLEVLAAPAITSADHTIFTTGVAGSFTVTATGFPVPTIGLSGALPDGVTFTDNGDGTATLAGAAAAGASGVYPLTFTASNGVLPDARQDFTLEVQSRVYRVYLPLVVKQ
jgi:uncharacterized delta-60 repeat protein